MSGAASTRWQPTRMLSSVLHRCGVLRLVRPLTDRLRIHRRPDGTGFPAVRRSGGRALQILSLHRVGSGDDGFLESLPIDVFERQMRALARNSSVLALDEAVDGLRSGNLPAQAVAITFDDGYRDNYLHAFPILQSLGLPATIFLVTGSIGSDRLMWHDRVFRAFAATPCRELAGFWPDGRTPSLVGADARVEARRGVLRHLKRLDYERRESEIGRLIGCLRVDDVREHAGLMLTWDDVRRMGRAGIAFGAHTVHHPVLSRIPPDRARGEVQASKAAIEAETGVRVRAFAYPNGGRDDFDEGTKSVLREAGIDHAVTTIFGTNEVARGIPLDPLELRRILMAPWAPAEFLARLHLYRMTAGGRP